MRKKIKSALQFCEKFISGWTILSLFFTMTGIGIAFPAIADDAATSVNVDNDAPSFSVAPHEDPTSDTTTPTNMDANVTFKATATDTNGNDWYLAICKSNAIATSTDGAPTCPGDAWGISNAASSTAEATVAYTITSGEADESYAWYGFACDKTAGNSQCSEMSNTGTSGNNGSPFAVNHRPTFSAVSDEAGNPGASDVTITATTYDDDDDDGSQDTVSLYVCKTAAFNGSSCTGGEWCHSDPAVAPPGALACDLTVPDPQAHGEVNYYPYLVDSHSLQASGGQHGSTQSYTVNDVVPTISGTPSLNGGAAMDLTNELSTTDIYFTGLVSDDNGCDDITASTTADIWLHSIGHTACDSAGESNGNTCYPRLVCAYDAAVEECIDADDKTGGYKCTIPFQYYANPTDSGTPWSGIGWTGTLVPADGQGINEGGAGNSATTTMNSFLALSMESGYNAIAYGSMSINTHTETLLEKVRVQAAGNCALNANMSGTSMTGTGDPITAANQRYAASAVSWASGIELSGVAAPFALGVCKSGYTGTPEYKPIYWGINIPAGQLPGSYTGTNTVSAVKKPWSNPNDWCESP